MSLDPDWRHRTAIHKHWTSTISGVAVLAFAAFVLWLFFGAH